MALKNYTRMVIRTLHPFKGESDSPVHVHGIVAILIIITYLAMTFLQMDVPPHLLSALTLVLGFLFGKHYSEEPD